MKKLIQNIIFPIGSKQRILRGYLKGSHIIVSENTQWAPIIGRWEPAMQKIIANTVNEGNIFYDLGANFGLHGLLSAKYLGANGYIYNFDPLPSNLEEIKVNYALNGVENYTNIQKAVSNKNGNTEFNVAHHNGQGSLGIKREGSGKIVVETTTLDSFISDSNPLPDFIKMDIEGAEGDALEGFVQHIEKSFPVMIIELHSPEADKKVGQFLKFYKYDAYRFDTFKGLEFEKIKNLESPHPDKEGIWGSVLCCPQSKPLDSFQFNK